MRRQLHVRDVPRLCGSRFLGADSGRAKQNEKFMLSIAAEGPEPNSRLSCQIKMTEELDGIIVRLPRKQSEARGTI